MQPVNGRKFFSTKRTSALHEKRSCSQHPSPSSWTKYSGTCHFSPVASLSTTKALLESETLHPSQRQQLEPSCGFRNADLELLVVCVCAKEEPRPCNARTPYTIPPQLCVRPQAQPLNAPCAFSDCWLLRAAALGFRGLVFWR